MLRCLLTVCVLPSSSVGRGPTITLLPNGPYVLTSINSAGSHWRKTILGIMGQNHWRCWLYLVPTRPPFCTDEGGPRTAGCVVCNKCDSCLAPTWLWLPSKGVLACILEHLPHSPCHPRPACGVQTTGHYRYRRYPRYKAEINSRRIFRQSQIPMT